MNRTWKSRIGQGLALLLVGLIWQGTASSANAAANLNPKLTQLVEEVMTLIPDMANQPKDMQRLRGVLDDLIDLMMEGGNGQGPLQGNGNPRGTGQGKGQGHGKGKGNSDDGCERGNGASAKGGAGGKDRCGCVGRGMGLANQDAAGRMGAGHQTGAAGCGQQAGGKSGQGDQAAKNAGKVRCGMKDVGGIQQAGNGKPGTTTGAAGNVGAAGKTGATGKTQTIASVGCKAGKSATQPKNSPTMVASAKGGQSLVGAQAKSPAAKSGATHATAAKSVSQGAAAPRQSTTRPNTAQAQPKTATRAATQQRGPANHATTSQARQRQALAGGRNVGSKAGGGKRR